MPGMNGIEITQQSKTTSPETRVIICSTKSDELNVLSALRAGAKGYVLKTASFDELNNAIHKVYSGVYYLSDEVLERVIEYYCQSNHEYGSYKNPDQPGKGDSTISEGRINENRDIAPVEHKPPYR